MNTEKTKIKAYFLRPTLAIRCLIFASILLNFSIAQGTELSDKYTLDNGMTLIVSKIPTSPVVAFDLLVKTGSATENEFLGSGISHYIEHMFFKGTPKRPVGQIAKEVALLGGIINASTSLDSTIYTIEVPQESFEKALDILADMLINPIFDSAEAQKEKDVILNEIRLHNDNPARKFSDLVFQSIYLRHPYRYPVIGNESLFKNLTREDLLKYYHSRYSPNNIILSVAGNVEMEHAYRLVKEIFKDFKPSPYLTRNLPTEPLQISPRFTKEEYLTDLTRLALVYPSVSISDPDMVALDTLAMILGGGKSSRLYLDVLQKKGLVYSINVSNFTPVDKGLFEIFCVLDEKDVDEVIKAIQLQIGIIKQQGVSQEELNKTKKQVLSQYLFNRQTASDFAQTAAFDEFYLGDYQFGEKYVSAINAVTSNDIKRVALKYLTPVTLNTVILKPKGSAAQQPKKSELSQVPEIEKIILDNGFKILLREDHTFPLVSIHLALRGGLGQEDEKINGISNLMAQVWIKGTSTRSSEDISKAVESRGAALSRFSGRNSFGLTFNALSQDLDFALELLADLVLSPTFPGNEIAKEKEKIKSSILAQNDSVFTKTSQDLRKSLFLSHPFRMDELGTLGSVAAITQNQMKEFYGRLRVPDNMVFSIFGDFNKNEILPVLKKRFSNLQKQNAHLKEQAESPPEKTRENVSEMNKEQAVVMIGFQGPVLKNPDRYGIEILTSLLGSPLNGRLFTKIRDELGQSYTLGGSYTPGIDAGIINFYVATTNENVDKVKQLLMDQIKLIQDIDVSDEELLKVKTFLKGTYKMSLETNENFAFICGLNELYGLGFDHYKSYDEKIDKVSKEDLRKLAQNYLAIQKAAVAVTKSKAAEGLIK